ncbi:MAG: FG-GAP repeat protein [Planctomycetes bacterium]|nr:FG-GAP repeat protein [Planctomycetota bacterium]
MVVDDAGATYPLTIDPIAQQAYLKASNTGVDDRFGWSVSVSGDTVVVGAYLEDSGATGVNGNQSDNSAADAGAVYVFLRNGTTWSQQAYLKASNTNSGDWFGYSVAVSGDTVAVGAVNEDSSATGVNGDQSNNGASTSGAAYVFQRSGTAWSQQAYLKASNTGNSDIFGCSVAASGDTVVVGAHGEDSSATGVNGDQSNNGASGSGAAYVFVRSGTTWSQQAYLKASNTEAFDWFGYAVSVSGDGVAVAAYHEDSNATGVNGDQSNNGAADSGAAYVFARSGTTWNEQAYLKASNSSAGDLFGWSLSMSEDTVVVGALGEDSSATGVNGDQGSNGAADSGAAYVFVRSGTTWSQQAYVKASNTGAYHQFGCSVSVSGDRLVVGADCESSSATGVNGDQSDNSAAVAGAAYTFTRSGTTWSQQAYLKASNTESWDSFGLSVSMSDSTVVAGAPFEASSATGVNGDQSNNGAATSGAAYVFIVPCLPIITYGTGCAGSGGFIPDFAMSGCATAGESLSFSITNGLGGSLAWLFVGATQAALPMGAGCTLNVWPAIGPLGPLPLSGSGPGNGSISAVVAIPPASPLGQVSVQAFVVDPGAALGFSNSNGVQLDIQ